jgi:hypothetical protein
MSPSAPESDWPVGWLGELAGLSVPAEDAELLADALQHLGQQMTPLVARLEPGACITGDFDPRWP